MRNRQEYFKEYRKTKKYKDYQKKYIEDYKEERKKNIKKYNKEYYRKNKKKEQLRHYKNREYYGTYAKMHYQLNKNMYRGYSKKQQFKHKEIMKQLKINGCAICGYDKNNGSLDFHHVNSNDKIFGINISAIGYADKRLIKELNKCILLCKNCHYEIEHGSE